MQVGHDNSAQSVEEMLFPNLKQFKTWCQKSGKTVSLHKYKPLSLPHKMPH
jgi:hypothetical protein